MDAAFAHHRAPARGAALLLAHCAAVGGAEPREAAYERLRLLLGNDLAHLLVSALAPSRGARYRDVA